MATIEFAPRVEEIPAVRSEIRRLIGASPSNHGDDALYYCALTEVLINAVESHHDYTDKPIAVQVETDAPIPTVTVIDSGPGYDLESTLATRDTPAHGLKIALHGCPQMTVQSSASGTITTLPYTLRR